MAHQRCRRDREMFGNEEILERVVEWFKTGKARPFMLELRPTNLCNLRCPSCVARGYPPYTPGEELSLADYERIIDEAAELGVGYVQIVGGGEPFMRREKVLGMMRCIKRYNMKGFVVTNGTLFDAELIRELVEMAWDTIFLSLDAPNPELNDFLRDKPGCFEKIVTAIHKFKNLKRAHNQDLPQLDLGPVLSHYNCRAIVDMVRLCADVGLDNLSFQPVRVHDDEAGKPFLLTGEDLKALAVEVPKARKLADELGVRNNLHELDREMLEGSSKLPEVIQSYSSEFKDYPILSLHCLSPWFYIGINADGTVGPCSIDHPTTYKGDIRDSSLKAYWDGSHFQAFREGLLRKELPEACANCCGTNVIEIKKLRERLREVIPCD